MGKTLVQNKKARHDYFILETYEAGIELVGTEVKSVRQGKMNLKDSYVDIKRGEAFLIGAHISPYEHGNIFNRDPERVRKLLLKKQEIMKLTGKLTEKGLTIVPLEVYLNKNWIKLSIGLAQGKKNYDKRDAKAEADAKRNMDRALKERNFR
ncbi:MAG: SsrA-binding protein SmpB [Clostridia bacterium]|nr:SsrA-binding protein SmpB [Clostridia bacterium]